MFDFLKKISPDAIWKKYFYESPEKQEETIEKLLYLAKDKASFDEIFYLAAVTYKRLDIAQSLLAKGADINARTGQFESSTPLIDASFEGDVKIINWLIDHGADVSLKNKRKETALMYLADRVTYAPLAQKMIDKYPSLVYDENTEGNVALLFAVQSLNRPVIRTLILAGAEEGHMNVKGETPLSKAKDMAGGLFKRQESLITLNNAILERNRISHKARSCVFNSEYTR